ncbi:MAG TPA: type II toxin-antitoxin system HicB family antitoxin [Candidatus Paceibacterota bacterium]
MLNERNYTIETEQEADGRWIAEIVELPGALAYGSNKEEAQAKAEALAFRVLAEEIEESQEAGPIGFSKIAFSRA